MVAGDSPDCILHLSGADAPTSLATLRGGVVYLDFWASWCGPCSDAFPFMNDLARDLGARGLHVVAVNLDDDVADAEAFLKGHPARFSVALAAGPACARAFGVRGLPAAFVIDRSGVVRATHYGFRQGEAREARALVERLLADPRPVPRP